MKKSPTSTLRLSSLLLLVSSTCALADEAVPTHFSGLINDYTPSNVKGGPYEMRGQWSLELRREWGTGGTSADFLADIAMSGYVTTVVTTPPPPEGPGTVAVETQAGVGAHTHHIKLSNVTVTWNMVGCPTYATNPSTGGFQFSGTVNMVTGNGSSAPFETMPPSSILQVCVTGGTEVAYSNITLVFSGPPTSALSHFGPQAIHGVVRKASDDRDGDR